jgi:hypothetical protein
VTFEIGGYMGLSDELTILQDLHEKGKLTDQEFAAAKAATLQKHGGTSAAGAPAANAKLGFKWSRLALLLVVVFIAWVFMRQKFGNKGTNQVIAAVVHTPIEVKNEVENLPASSWKAVAFNLPYSGSVDVNLEVVTGNPVDVYVTTPDQLEAMKKEQWTHVTVYTDFNATKTKTYRRSARLGQGAYYLVLRDTSLGILSSSASDVSLKIQLNP